MTLTQRCTARRRLSTMAWIVAAAALVTACRDSTPALPRTQLRSLSAVQARLTFSNTSPKKGDEVVAYIGVLSGVGVQAVGSFTARIAYDSTLLAFVGEGPHRSDGMRAVNPLPGETRVAGVSTSGFHEGELAALRFVARRGALVGQPSLVIDELHSVDRVDLLPKVSSRQVVAQPAGQ